MSEQNLSSFIWSVADLLRGDYKQSEYGKVILPFTVLRRLDCVLESTKAAVLTELDKRSKAKVNPEPFLLRTANQLFYNTSPLDLKKLMGDQDHIGENLRAYMQAFSPDLPTACLASNSTTCSQIRNGRYRPRTSNICDVHHKPSSKCAGIPAALRISDFGFIGMSSKTCE